MPNQTQWEQFFDPFEIFKKFGLINEKTIGADIACGFGTFTIPLAKLNTNTIYAVDINDEFLTQLEDYAKKNNLSNIKILNADISDPDFQLPEKIGYALLFNILHCENPEFIIKNVFKNLNEDGKIFVIHWRSDIKTPRGPPLVIRPKIQDIELLFTKLGFQVEKQFEVISPYHYGISFKRNE